MEILKVTNLKKTYSPKSGGTPVNALKGASFTVERGEYVAVMGESGSGKTTLLNILASLDKPTSGSVVLDGKDLSALRESELASFRRGNLGFVFQEFNLLDTLTLRDNILLPLVLSGCSVDEMERRLSAIAGSLGIDAILNKYPYEVSGGQKQRAAAARAIITDPKIVLADEPTGALDSQSSSDLLSVFSEMNRRGQTILMVTHSVDAASHAGRVMFIRDGVVYHQIFRGDCSNEELYRKITDTLTMLRTGRNVQ